MSRCAMCDFDDHGNHAASCPGGKEQRADAADRARRIRALAAHRALSYLDEMPNMNLDADDYATAINVATGIVDALDALPVPKRGE